MSSSTGLLDKPYSNSQSIGSRVSNSGQTLFDSTIGIGVSAIILLLWGSSLVVLTRIDLSTLSVWLLPAILGRTFLHTGLFIIAHDAMHGTVCPSDRRTNHLIGKMALTLYGFLLYDRCLERHWQHHRYPGRLGDPDYHDGLHNSAIGWYFSFMRRYIDAQQMLVLGIGMTVAFHGLHFVLHAPYLNLLLLWVVPTILSSIQLFYFGTYLTHRLPEGGYDNSHHAKSISFPAFWSFLACYHFGYHWEHHEYPHLPWYKLPTTRSKPEPSTLNSIAPSQT